jgi:hypothetical protein
LAAAGAGHIHGVVPHLLPFSMRTARLSWSRIQRRTSRIGNSC